MHMMREYVDLHQRWCRLHAVRDELVRQNLQLREDLAAAQKEVLALKSDLSLLLAQRPWVAEGLQEAQRAISVALQALQRANS